MRRKKVAVVGNCQATFTAKMYREFFGVPAHEDVRYVDDLHLAGSAMWAEVADCDLVLLQQRDFNSPRAEDAPAGTEVVTFPLVLEAFLWPYAHEPHVHNRPEPPLHDGPYPAQLGDKFLNRMIVQGVAPEEALERYLDHDIAGATHIDRLLELHLDQQRDRDERTGFTVAPILERGFRDQALFMSPHHPNAWMFGEVLDQLFTKMGLARDGITAFRDALVFSPFPSGELPVHPGVARHFGLGYVRDDARYHFHDEGRFTFAEHVLRYMRYAHNHALRVGTRFFHEHRWDEALPLLEEGLVSSPHAARAWRARGLILGAAGRRDEAVASFDRSIAEDAGEPDAYADLSRTLMELGRKDEALHWARRAVALQPRHGPSQLILGELLFNEVRDYPAARDAACEGARLLPMEGYPAWVAAICCWYVGKEDAARTWCLRALNLDPRLVDPRNLLAEAHLRRDDRAEALRVLEEGIALDAANDHTFWIAAGAAWGLGDAGRAREFCLRALQLDPRKVDARNLLAEGYERDGRRDEALAALQEGVALGAANDQTFSLIGNYHLRKALESEGETRKSGLTHALQAFTEGLKLKPDRRELVDQIEEMHWRLAACA